MSGDNPLYQKELNKHSLCVEHYSQQTSINMNKNQIYINCKDVITDNKCIQKPLENYNHVLHKIVFHRD